MKRLLLALFAFVLPIAAQSTSAGPAAVVNGHYNFGVVTTTGQLGRWLTYSYLPASASNYSIDWNFSGLAPATCTFQGEGSSDGLAGHWINLTGPQDCTTANGLSVANKPFLYFRINILTYTQGDVTTSLTFNYTAGR